MSVKSIDGDAIAPFLSADIAPVFWAADLLDQPSAWFSHIPFAHWVVAQTRPALFVELGTHAAVSYAAFCRSVVKENVKTKCFAVDTWKGDSQAGEYSDEVYSHVKRYNDERFSDFSILLRSTFDDAVQQFQDGSIDLLHIDGFHSYEAVKNDFETWQPKLSQRAVVLFHDTNEHQPGFGVWRFWGEVAKDYPTFEFLHGHGLGVLAYGKDAPIAIRSLCALEGSDVVDLRSCFQFVGERWLAEARVIQQQKKFDTELDLVTKEASDARNAAEEEKNRAIESANAEAKQTVDHVESIYKQKVDLLEGSIRDLEHRLEMLFSSKSWRLTRPLRAVRRMLNQGGLK